MVTRRTPLAVHHVTLIDATGAVPIGDATVLFEDGRVKLIGPSAQVQLPAGCEAIDGHGKWLLPGLADTHVHVALSAGEPALRHWLAWGRHHGAESRRRS